ncbi:MAG: flagellar biosynthesis anti-sigma factor FlgM [Eubacteriales bacterium]|nr:flagellar biosynthesis anti-sigma factor FlgM [Eubacteriales bacterium]
MRIDAVYSVATQYNKVQNTRRLTTEQVNAPQDAIELSDQARLFSDVLAAAKAQHSETEAAHAAKTVQIADQIENGSYEVSAEDLIGKILI